MPASILHLGLRWVKTLNRKVAGVTYWKRRIDVPSDIADDIEDRLGWARNEELEAEIRGDAIIIRKKK